MKILKRFVLLILLSVSSCGQKETNNSKIDMTKLKWNLSVATSANSWVFDSPSETNKMITKSGIDFWTNPESKIRTYFRVENTGDISIGVRAKVENGESTIKLFFNGKSKKFVLNNNVFEDKYIATFNVDTPGYYFIELQGVKKKSDEFAEVTKVLISGKASEGKSYFVKEDVYWGRRGPSVHLNYEIPKEANNVVWFYNEMTIEKSQDVIGSYFMANGFAEGYFGIQVNSENERTVLFSVWSPFKTDDPKSIPKDQKIVLLKKGKDVITAEFGNEGSGGQSRFLYNWIAGNKYKFLVKANPSKNKSTDYTAYFYAPEIGKWKLIASFRRPKTATYIVRPHSFLENFIPSMGNVEREVNFSNQWVCDSKGKWFELTRAKFTADATARKESRLDYAGGSKGDSFFLKNCGFFSFNSKINSFYNRNQSNGSPKIDFLNLP